jgi:hypothetical protein
MKFLNSLVIICLLSIGLQAQNYKVSGSVLDSTTQKPLIGANVALESTYDNSIIKGTSTDLDGKFNLEVAPGSYRISVSFVGFKEQKKRLFVQDKDIDMGKITLAESVLSEVLVEGRVPPVVLKGDTSEYNANAFKTNPDATAEDLVEKMPGVTIVDGKVQAQGEDVRQVLVDGKPFFGGDPKATLKNIPAEMIDKVQVYDQGSASSGFSGFDDGNTQKTINIISKPEYRSGTFGRVYAAGGYDDNFQPGGERYKLGGVLNSFKDNRRITVLGQFNNTNEQNFASDDLAGVMSAGGGGGMGRGGSGGGGRGGMGGGPPGSGTNIGQFLVNDQGGITRTNAFGINYADKWGKKMDVSGSYFFNYTDNQVQTISDQIFITNSDSGLVYNKTDIAGSKNMNHRANFRLDYKINERNNIQIAPRFSLQTNNGLSELLGENNRNGDFINSTLRTFNSDVFAWTLNNSITYNHAFKKKGRTISVTLSDDHKSNIAESFLRAVNTLSADALIRDTLDQTTNQIQFENTISARVEHSEPLGKLSQLQIVYNPSISYNDIDKKTFGYDSQSEQYNTLDTFLSSISKNQYHTQNGGLGWRYNKENLNIQARVNFQWASLSVAQTYPTLYNDKLNFYSVLPFASLRYKISKTKNLRAFYRSSANAPAITQLQESVNNSNPLQLSVGNSKLKQEESHRFNIHYSAPNPEKNSMFFTMLSLSYTNNYIGNSNFIAGSDTTLYGVELTRGTQITRPVNFSNRMTAMAFTTIGLPLKALKSNLNFNISANYNRTPGLINDQINYANTPSGSLGITISSNISTKLDFTLSSNSSINGTVNTLNTGLNSKFFNQNSKLRFYWNPWKTLVLRTDVSHQYYSGLGDGFSQNFLLWNASIATKVFKNKQGEISLMVFDILKQNNAISRNFTETYIETNTTTVLQRYLMLQFTYKFKPKKGDIPMDQEKQDLERYNMMRQNQK